MLVQQPGVVLRQLLVDSARGFGRGALGGGALGKLAPAQVVLGFVI